MKALVNIELTYTGDTFAFLLDFADGPLPRVGESIHFDLAHDFVVDRIQHVFLDGRAAGTAPEVWLYCVQGDVEAEMGYTEALYRADLSTVAAITWEN